jgi:hypothetical protein
MQGAVIAARPTRKLGRYRGGEWHNSGKSRRARPRQVLEAIEHLWECSYVRLARQASSQGHRRAHAVSTNG